MVSSIISRLVILLFGTLYPAYASYKAVKTKNVKEYVKWMMYWIVFALFTCAETFTDVFFSWFPFYYEIKIILVIWLLSPATKGSSILYRKFVHPMLSSREQEIDEYISKAKEQSYRHVLDLGSKGVTALMQTALKGGGGIVNHLRKSYSLSDLSDPSHDHEDGQDETDLILDPRLLRRRRSPHRTISSSSALYFSEVDVRASGAIAHIQSVEDISSGYSSGEGLYPGQPPKLQPREALTRTGSLTRSRTGRVTRSSAIPKKSTGSDDSDESEIFDTNIIFLNDQAAPLNKLQQKDPESSSEGEFVDANDDVENLHGNKKQESLNLNSITMLLTACDDFSKATCNVDTDPISPTNRIEEKAASNENCVSKQTTSKEEKPVVAGIVNPSISTETSGKFIDPFELVLSSLKDTPVETKSTYVSSEFKNPLQNKVDVVTSVPLDCTTDIANKISDDKMKQEINSGSEVQQINRTDSFETISLSSIDDRILLNVIADTDLKAERRGKYHKKTAPPPPPTPPKSDEIGPNTRNKDTSAITATLVLKPGVVKSVGLKTEDSPVREVFINSPKLKRKSLLNRSPSPSTRSSSPSSSSSTKIKSGSSIAKLLKLPKKINLWHKSGSEKSQIQKRFSWNESDKKELKLPIAKVQSRSVTDLTTVDKEFVPVIDDGEDVKYSSALSIRTLSESPTVKRRLKIIRRFVDEDID